MRAMVFTGRCYETDGQLPSRSSTVVIDLTLTVLVSSLKNYV